MAGSRGNSFVKIVKDDRRGWDKLERRIKEAHGKHVVAGITAEAGAPEPGGPTVAEYATINELGLGVPARPFMAHFYDGKKRWINNFSDNALMQFINGVTTLDASLSAVGLMLQDGIRESIRTAYQWAEPNSDATHLAKLKKGEWNQKHFAAVGPNMTTKPLIDHGIMLNSVTFEIRNGMLR